MGLLLNLTGGPTISAVGKPVKSAKRTRGAHVRFMPPGDLVCLHCGDSYSFNLPVPMSIIGAAMKAYGKEHTKCRLDKTRGLSCHYCYKFGHPQNECPKLAYGGDPVKWLDGPDTGASSKRLWWHMQHGSGPPGWVPERGPLDPEDFGRAYRLLKAFPQWRARIGEMTAVPCWAGIATAWDELEKLYEAGELEALYNKMTGINGQA